MDNNPMETIYKHFGKEKEEGQAMMSIANIFYEIGHKEELEQTEKDKLIRELAKELAK